MQLQVGTRLVEAELIIFDKDGTLVDLHAPWGEWAESVAGSLAALIPPELFLPRLGWSMKDRRIAPETPLAVASVAAVQAVIATWLYEAGLGWTEAMSTATQATMQAETRPAPPICALAPLFETLTAHGLKLAVVTTDDRAGVERDLGPLGVLSYLDVIVGGDAGVATKPAPDMMLAACAAAEVTPACTIMVGDSVADMWMGRAAGAALVVGVLSGASPETVLAPHADVLLPSVAGLLGTTT
ncbi:MAG TPA: HAD family hydrolase [Herpetosiphonaceae bacterium]|nr:HAD family hydrolase [Herpetosiphonaceae bacterium]